MEGQDFIMCSYFTRGSASGISTESRKWNRGSMQVDTAFEDGRQSGGLVGRCVLDLLRDRHGPPWADAAALARVSAQNPPRCGSGHESLDFAAGGTVEIARDGVSERGSGGGE